jgi:tight adherence protein B
VTAVVLALLAAYGVHLLYTGVALGWRGLRVGPARLRPPRARRRVADWLAQAGLNDVPPRDFAAVLGVVCFIGALSAYALFGAPLPALAGGVLAACFPVAAARGRRARRRSDAADAWPRLIEEMRLQTGSLGRSVTQALFAVGRRGPTDFQPAFAAAEREWLLTTDFARTVALLKQRLADPTADVTLETLLVAHEVGGSELDRRLAALVEDRVLDLQGRKDARARQAGVRFARRFVLIVPLGMAFAGLSIGTGRTAYQSAMGQIAVIAGIAVMGACWFWAGTLMRLPEEDRVFAGRPS